MYGQTADKTGTGGEWIKRAIEKGKKKQERRDDTERMRRKDIDNEVEGEEWDVKNQRSGQKKNAEGEKEDTEQL